MIIDASIAAKWLLQDESDTDLAQGLRFHRNCIAPDLILLEVANSCVKRLQRKALTDLQVIHLIEFIPGLVENLVPSRDLIAPAGRIAAKLVHPIYDCIYLALAERETMPLVTVDQRLIDAGRKLGSVRVIHLRDL
jgi:predicted nucleic acid-binding protein